MVHELSGGNQHHWSIHGAAFRDSTLVKHMLRNAGQSIENIMRVIGHSSTQSVDYYIHERLTIPEKPRQTFFYSHRLQYNNCYSVAYWGTASTTPNPPSSTPNTRNRRMNIVTDSPQIKSEAHELIQKHLGPRRIPNPLSRHPYPFHPYSRNPSFFGPISSTITIQWRPYVTSSNHTRYSRYPGRFPV